VSLNANKLWVWVNWPRMLFTWCIIFYCSEYVFLEKVVVFIIREFLPLYLYTTTHHGPHISYRTGWRFTRLPNKELNFLWCMICAYKWYTLGPLDFSCTSDLYRVMLSFCNVSLPHTYRLIIHNPKLNVLIQYSNKNLSLWSKFLNVQSKFCTNAWVIFRKFLTQSSIRICICKSI